MEGLFSYDLNSSKIEVTPQLVKSYSHKNKYKEWTFTLKENVYWSDGQNLIAQHFIDAWQRLLTESTASPHAHRLFTIKNAKNFYLKKSEASSLGLKIISKYSFSVELEQSSPHFPKLLTGFFTFPIRKDLLKNNSLNTNVILGPYQIDKKNESSSTCLTATPNYHAKKPQIKNVCFTWLDKPSTALQLFKSGQLDFVRSPLLTGVQSKNLMKHYNSSPSHGIYFLTFNLNKAPGNSLPFRKAVKESVDYKKLSILAESNYDAFQNFYPSSIFKSTSLNKKSSHKSSSLKINGKIVIASNNNEFNSLILSHLSHEFNKKLSLKSEVQLLPGKLYFSSLKENNNFDIFRLSWTPALTTAYAYAQLFTSDFPNNFTGYKNKQYDNLVQSALTEENDTRKNDIYSKIENHILNKEVLAIPLFTTRHSFLIRKDKFSLKAHPTERIDFINVKVN